MRHRSTAAALVLAGKVRINRQPTQKPAHPVKPHDILTLALNEDVRVIEVLAEAERRGPAPEARKLYTELALAKKPGGGDENQDA